ncbi:hypothetical protein [Saccharophagus sp. K07]|nr:hypothetical protein [Saccharophagus sp. K07]
MSREKPYKAITTFVVVAATAVMIFYSEQAMAGQKNSFQVCVVQQG